MRRDLPSGTVTFLFTDVEGSTRLLHELGPEAYAHELQEHRRALRGVFARHDGVEVDTQGDAFFAAFPTADGAVAAARDGQHELTGGPRSSCAWGCTRARRTCSIAVWTRGIASCSTRPSSTRSP